MNVLQVVDAAPRAHRSREDDPLSWIERASTQAAAKVYVLLQGEAVRYARACAHGATDADVARLCALAERGVSIYAVRDDAVERGLALDELASPVELVARADVPALYARHDQVWLW
jgi:intracellular sulfur oxidation DsrE/DsrF family protein